MPTALTSASFLHHLSPGRRVYWPGCAAHSALFEAWLRAAPEHAAGVHFCGVWIPGINRFDPTALHADARAVTFFMTPELRAGWARGAVDLLPLHYSRIATLLAEPRRFDTALLQVAPPDAQGRCSLSVTADFGPSVLQGLAADATVFAHVNPLLPRTRGPWVSQQRITAWVEAPMTPLTVTETAPNAATVALAAVAAQVAAQVHDGDTLQFGLGRLQAEVLKALQSHRRLRIHSGMVSDGLLGLLQAGALAPLSETDPPVCTGVALGSTALYAALADPALARFAPVSHTHAQATLAAVPRLLSVNSALQVDLLGNVNADVQGGRFASGVGGMVDFVRGAVAGAGGRSLIALSATGGRDGASRIVPLLDAAAVGLARSDIDGVATEHGVAWLRHLGVNDRARALIGLAAPQHRDALQSAWHTLKSQL